MVYHNKKTFLISSGAYAEEWEWDGTGFISKSENSRHKNARLRDFVSKIDNAIYDLEKSGLIESLNMKALKELIERFLSGKNTNSFIEYVDKFLLTKSNKSTLGLYHDTKNKIILFDKDATFSSITPEWLMHFENYLKSSGMQTNSIGIHLRNIRSVFNFCIDNDYTTSYPFRRFKIKKQVTAKRALKIDQLRILRDYPCEDHQIIYRDLFILIFYLIGINPIDLFNLKRIKDGRIEYIRAKTGRSYSIKVEGEAQQIIDKYGGKEYLLDILDRYKNYKDFTHRMNLNLKQIGNMERTGLGGKKVREPLFPDITIYHARHTWATIASNLDIPKETISAALGHSIGSDVTEIYIDFDTSKIDKANRMVIDYVNGIL